MFIISFSDDLNSGLNLSNIFLDVDVQVVRCCLEHAASVAKIFLTSDVVVTEIKEAEPANVGGNPMDASGTGTFLLCCVCSAVHCIQGYCL